MDSWLVGSLAFCQAGCALTLRHIEDTMRDEHKQSGTLTMRLPNYEVSQFDA